MNVTVTPMRPSSGTEQLHELDEGLRAHRAENVGHALAHRQPLAADVMVREHLRARHHVLQRDEHLLQRDLGLQPDDMAIDQLGCRRERVALDAMQLIDVERGALEALVFLQAAHELGARIGLFLVQRPAAAAAACAI